MKIHKGIFSIIPSFKKHSTEFKMKIEQIARNMYET